MLDYERELCGAVDGDALRVPVEWEGFPGQAFGGFIAAAALVAAAKHTDHPRPLSAFTRFFRPVPLESPVQLDVSAERRGRSAK